MNFDPAALLKWVETLTPEKLPLVIPFIAAYIIIRTRTLSNNWIWLICTVLGGALFVLLVPADAHRSVSLDVTYRISMGVVYGFIAALFVLGLHGVIFKAAAEKWPALKFLVLDDETTSAPADKPKDQ